MSLPAAASDRFANLATVPVGPDSLPAAKLSGLHRPLDVAEFALGAGEAVEHDLRAMLVHVTQAFDLVVAVDDPRVHVAVVGVDAVAIEQDGLRIGAGNGIPVDGCRRQACQGKRGEGGTQDQLAHIEFG